MMYKKLKGKNNGWKIDRCFSAKKLPGGMGDFSDDVVGSVINIVLLFCSSEEHEMIILLLICVCVCFFKIKC